MHCTFFIHVQSYTHFFNTFSQLHQSDTADLIEELVRHIEAHKGESEDWLERFQGKVRDSKAINCAWNLQTVKDKSYLI